MSAVSVSTEMVKKSKARKLIDGFLAGIFTLIINALNVVTNGQMRLKRIFNFSKMEM